MAGNVNNSNTISGRGMAVLIGVILTVGPWFTQIGFFSKLGVAIIGIILILLGVRD
jgi:hypothetical protein